MHTRVSKFDGEGVRCASNVFHVVHRVARGLVDSRTYRPGLEHGAVDGFYCGGSAGGEGV